jgi:phosphoribosyl 1,2-cyclic phosphodiesterase
MSLYFTSLNSGSNANCYYVGTSQEAVLIDAGLSCRETEKRMARLGLAMENVKAVFVSHEHTDHITGIPVLSRKHRIPVYITSGTLRNTSLSVEPELVRNFRANQTVRVGNLGILAFTKSHDASDPHSFMVTGHDVNIGVFTDIGYPCKEVIRHFKQCHAAFLESNYCEEMLETGSYPRHLKNRISGKKGHLSNAQALELFIKHRPRQLTHLILSHLSENNNNPELVDRLFREKAGKVKIVVASRYEESALFHIRAAVKPFVKVLPRSQGQLSLF